MAADLPAAKRLYEAFAKRDAEGILGALHTDFTGEVSQGMPLGVGGLHAGREAMLGEVWGPVFSAYEMNVEVDEMIPGADGRIVVLGHYRGTLRGTGEEVDAVFAHVLSTEGGQILRLVQITDTASWVPQGASRPQTPS